MARTGSQGSVRGTGGPGRSTAQTKKPAATGTNSRAKNPDGSRTAETKADLQEKVRKLTKQLSGSKSKAKGDVFEKQVGNYYSKHGWREPQFNQLIEGHEYDIIAKKTRVREDGFSESRETEWLLVECKDKERVTDRDVTSFINKVASFGKKHRGAVTAVFVYRGRLPENAVKVAKTHKPTIEFVDFAHLAA
ncbi:MAG: restriction endonuclease [Chloroflexi bacterium]|nr:restriction endonuclease [Chloroflexota bacterium]